MHSLELSSLIFSEIRDSILTLNLGHETTEKLAYETARKLSREGNRLFYELSENASSGENDEETGRSAVSIGKDIARHLRNISDIAGRLHKLLISEPVADCGGERKSHII